jgi:hypothetical protein
MDRVNGSPFKLVYTDWWSSRKYLGVVRFKFPMPNGLHPSLVKKVHEVLSNEGITNPILLEKSMMRSTILADTFQQKDPVTGFDNGNFFRHGNFLGYWQKQFFINESKLNYEYVVNVDDIDVNDDYIYYYPIEVECHGLRLLSDKVTITVDGENYDYQLVDTWPEKLLNLFKIGKVKILVVNIVDACGPEIFLNTFEDQIVEKGIDPKNLIWLKGDIPNFYFDSERKHKSIILNGCLSLRQASENLSKYPRETSYTPEHKILSDVVRSSDLNPNEIRPYKFLSFNRSMDRPHRIAIAYFALKHNLLDQGIFSFLNHFNESLIIDHLQMIFSNEDKAYVRLITDDVVDTSNYFDKVIVLPNKDLDKDGGWELINHWQICDVNPHEDTIKLEADLYIPKSIEYWSELFNYATKLWKMFPYEVDTQMLDRVQKTNFQNIDLNIKEIYNSAYINIVTETNGWDQLDSFWSEKTWRPILNLQPFIYVGPYNSLKRLKEMGFKTFSPFIDESYDNEIDMRVRILMIEKEILKFKNLTIKEIHDWYYSITDILIHNQLLIYSFSNYNPLQNLVDYKS